MGSILISQKTWDADTKFTKEVSSGSKNMECRCNLHDRQAEKYLQVQRKASCRYNGLKRASATANKRDVQIHEVYIEKDSKWIVPEDSTLSTLENAGTMLYKEYSINIKLLEILGEICILYYRIAYAIMPVGKTI